MQKNRPSLFSFVTDKLSRGVPVNTTLFDSSSGTAFYASPET